MKYSLMVPCVQPLGRPPDHLSIVALTTPAGRGKLAMGMPAVTSRTKARQSGAAAVSDVAGLRDAGIE